MGPQRAVDRGPQCTTACTRKERDRACADRKAPSQTNVATPRTPPHQGRRHTKDAILYEMRCGNGNQYNASRIYWDMWSNCLRRQLVAPPRPVDPPQLRHPNPRETSKNGTLIVKAA